MPKEKKDLDKTKEKTKKTSTKTNKSKVVKKTTKTTTAKKASAKVSKPSIVKSPKKEEKTKKELKPKKEEITIDIISDNEEVLSEARDLVLPKKSREEISEKDLQKKYFSQLVDEMKGRGPNLNQEEYFNKSSAGPSLALYRRLFWRFSAGILIFLVLLFYLFFTKLTIIIHPKSELINDSLSFNLLSNEQRGDELSLQAERNLIGKLEKINLSVDKLYNASGENPVSEEVSGELIIYNNYSQSQTLIASTRLLSSSSKLFRLSETVNVPAGSSIKASVYADIASPEMAISADSFTIPGLWLGLQDKIYAESYEPFVYNNKINNFVRQQDLDSALNNIKASLKDKLENYLNLERSQGRTVAYDFNEDDIKYELKAKLGEITKEFRAQASGDLLIASFSPAELENLVKAKLLFILPDDKKLSKFNPSEIEYEIESFDLESGQASLKAYFQAEMVLRTDADLVRLNRLVNLKEAQIEEYLRQYPEIESFELKFSPKFLRKAPFLVDRIKILVD